MEHMSRSYAAVFNDMDVPRGRFAKPPRKVTRINFWPMLADELTNGIVQCVESRERLALFHTTSANDITNISFDIHKDMWYRMVLWSAYRFFSTMGEMFLIDDISNYVAPDLVENGRWKLYCRTWDIRDAAKIKLIGPFLPALFSFHLENWTAMLSLGIHKGFDRHNARGTLTAMPFLKKILVGAMEIARFAVVLSLPICEYRTPMGLPEDEIGNAIRLCCAQMQANRLEPTEITNDAEGKSNDGSAEELYYRALHEIVKTAREHCRVQEDTPPTIQLNTGDSRYRQQRMWRNDPIRVPRSRLSNCKALERFRRDLGRGSIFL
ncbi:SORF4 protein [Gallid alphaherpesvirus 3]|uniref:SORF4 protein n=2 Tax=Gallid alphaherpesvirus 3 TaxID=35250 RepID=Q782M8_9ALPH|nr:protein SORF3 [Gallid alphaherpesvirus 3]YP_010795685.1 SORF4 protein [Gallid alphaherpesvirus 3]BAA32008.1 SORF3 [Marek's disease virus serotype 2 MDV2]AEI00294.1 SORF4 protein [Gallid alphaherpesvirus 3]QEY02259.1 SORF4 protein [Gallid alphaherpesvirus 3]BAB16587.1 SORF4 protein [Gallid alphaherpesvirus 3]